jgi:hypothetical protein
MRDAGSRSEERTVVAASAPRGGVAGYEPPRVERVLTPAELEREILYAGVPTFR